MRNHSRIIALFGPLISLAVAHAQSSTDFELRAERNTFRLSEARGQFVAVHFLLKTECPYCLRHVAEFSRRGPEVAGVIHVFVKPDSEADLNAWREKAAAAGIMATIYRDPDAALAHELKVPAGYSFHGATMHYPATILFDVNGREVFRHVGKDNTDRIPFDLFARKVAELTRNPALDQYNISDGQPAIKGYDPVAYVESNNAQEGRPEFSSAYRGVTYRFVSAENRATFAANPAKFAPAYGGWCATAMAEGRKVEIDPRNFKVSNGRLFLFYKGWLGDALSDWNKDEKGLTIRADEQWNKLAPKDAHIAK